MRYALRAALDRLHQEAEAADRPDLVQHVEGVRSILEMLCQKIDMAGAGGQTKDCQVDREDA
jgi:hypothetical protein